MTFIIQGSAFCAFRAPTGLRQSCYRNRLCAISRRTVHVNQVRRRARIPEMSLTDEVIIKGLEFAAATLVGNTLASQKAKKEPKNPFFHLGKKTRKRTKGFEQGHENIGNGTGVNAIVSEVLNIADQTSDFIAKGGPTGKKWVKLAICILIDLVGSGSLGVPIVGDMLDLVTAPVTSVMLQALFGSTFITMAGFAEEILPGTDAIPTATLAWLAENYGYLKSREEERSSS